MSPDNRVQQYRLGPSGLLRRYSDSRLVVLFLWAVPLETTPLLFRDLYSQLFAFPFPSVPVSFRLLVRMITKAVFLHGSACAFPVSAGTWPRGFLVLRSRSTRAEPLQCR